MRFRPAVATAAAIFAAASMNLSVGTAVAGTAPVQTVRAATPITPNGSWPVYHRDDGHTGYDPTAMHALGATTGWVSPSLDQNVYAEPLVYQGIVYAATLNNSVYALNQADGTVVWSTNLGAPETSGWSCGNVTPQGILGTPVIDPSTGRIYVVTFSGADDLYRLVGLNLATGLSELSTVITTQAATGFDWTIQQERGALAVHNGYVYVPFGGRAGDCGAYHGWIFAVPTNGGAPLNPYVTPGQGAGFWNAGGVVIDDSTGNVFNTSGNGTSSGCDAYPNGTPVFENDAVVVLSPTLTHLNAFIPQDWQANWCSNDQDLGSASMVLINPTLAFQAGKWGNGFLVNPQGLGGMDGQLYPTPQPASYNPVDVCYGNHSDANFGSYSYAAPYVYLSCDNNGLVGLKVTTTAPVSFSSCDSTCASPTWKAGSGTFGPPIVAGGAVWAVSTGGGGLYGFDTSTGAQMFHSAGFGATHFTTPSEAGNQVFVGSDTVIRSFNMLVGCRSVTASASPTSPAVVGTPVSITATASGCPSPSPQYEFWIKNPGAACCQSAQPYGTSNTYSWPTTGLAPGTYTFAVWAKDANSQGEFISSFGRYDASFVLQFTLSPPACPSVGASAAPASPSPVGTPIVITGAATGCTDASPQYEFWIRNPGGACCTMAQPYGPSASYNWPTTTLLGGTYTFAVWARDANSAGTFANSLGRYDASFVLTYTLTATPCTSVGAVSSPAGTTSSGTPVTITGNASGCPNARYQFEMLVANQIWKVVQPYSPSTVLNWDTTGAGAGTYRFIVKARDVNSAGTSSSSNGNWDAYVLITYTLTSTPCGGVTASSSPSGTTTVGTPVTITANASGCPNPRYQFEMLAPGSQIWVVVQPYPGGNVFNWSTATAAKGTYQFIVKTRDNSSVGTAGSSNSNGSWDAYVVVTYTLT